MRSFHGRLAALATLAALGPGCATSQPVRYVYQDHEFGVIGMPENSNRWPTHYRRRAEVMMKTHFPEGHEIVRAEEVVEGTRTLTVQGTNTAEVLPALPTALLSVGRLRRSSSRSQADRLKLKECRIIYRRVGPPDEPGVYAPVATLTPTRYRDPNESEPHPLPARIADAPGDENAQGDDAGSEPRLEPTAAELGAARQTAKRRHSATE